MGYAVAKELKCRPLDILTTWTCEELLVAYGVYANQRSQANFEMTPPSERRKKKVDEMDRWAIPFISYNQIEELEQKEEDNQFDEMEAIGKALFGF